ncbi:hypothetical protein [Streptacidiphilus sp. MAP5-52]|uniref:hypothetical protein n=1 Tax=Streptacidiphilus sp. MAP5-52 TaxID=3156267 RepID=UPI003519B6EA
MTDLLAACTARHTQHLPGLAAIVSSDAAQLLAQAFDPSVHHALDGRLPDLLASLDTEPLAYRDSVFSSALRTSGAAPDLASTGHLPAELLVPVAGSGSWLSDETLRDTLGAVVYTCLEVAEMRYTGMHGPGDRFTPGAVPLHEAFHDLCEAACEEAGLGPRWVAFAQIHTAHAVARANELPHRAGPLDPRIPTNLAYLAQVERITQADTLSNAIHDFSFSRPNPPHANEPGSRPASPRPQAARPRGILPRSPFPSTSVALTPAQTPRASRSL